MKGGFFSKTLDQDVTKAPTLSNPFQYDFWHVCGYVTILYFPFFINEIFFYHCQLGASYGY